MKTTLNKKQLATYLLSIFLIGVVAFSSACKKEQSFPFRVINNSGYDISQLSFSGATSSEEVSINHGDTLENIIASYPKRFRLTPKLLCITIHEFDQQGATFNVVQNKPCIPFSKKDLSEVSNTLTIISTVNSDTITFEYILE